MYSHNMGLTKQRIRRIFCDAHKKIISIKAVVSKKLSKFALAKHQFLLKKLTFFQNIFLIYPHLLSLKLNRSA